MAVTLDSMTNVAMLNQGSGTFATAGVSHVADVLAQANKRVEQKLDATRVQLSAFGQINSGFANVQSASKALSDPKKTGTAADVEKTAQAFAAAFNNATKTVSAAVNGAGKESGILANDAHARLAANDLKSIVTSGSNTADLKKIGISVNKDGTMSVDTKALQSAIQANPNAVKETLAKVGQQAERISTKDLAKNGNIGGSVNALSGRAKSLETQSAEQQKLASASQAVVQQQSAKMGSAVGSIAAYMQMFSL